MPPAGAWHASNRPIIRNRAATQVPAATAASDRFCDLASYRSASRPPVLGTPSTAVRRAMPEPPVHGIAQKLPNRV
jgi:hypothetical protein